MKKASDKLIVALDVDTLEEAKKLVKALGSRVTIYKVGSHLFTAYGPQAVEFLIKEKKKVFLDLKFHDIPNTVANAVKSVAGLNIFMLTIHVQGGEEMMKIAAQAAQKAGTKRPFVLGITVLTSESNRNNIPQLVLERVQLAKKCGLDGVVASSQEAKMISEKLGKDFMIVTPGIRPSGATAGPDRIIGADDQKRVSTPFNAISNGSHFLVVGRPIVEAENPAAATDQILKEIDKAL